MKKLGREVLFLRTNQENQRNGEGAFLRLKNGSIMYAYTEFRDSWADEAGACISAYFSYDEGETWADKRMIVDKMEKDSNIMSVSLLRMKNGDIGILYLSNTDLDGVRCCSPTFRRSSDEGITWTLPEKCLEENNRFIVNNDRMIRLKNGRILVPAAVHDPRKQIHKDTAPGEICFLASDDDGYTWKRLSALVQSPFHDEFRLQEPGIYEYEDGGIWLWTRTHYGCQMQAFSEDCGETWTKIEPNLFFTSPASPMQVKKAGIYTLAVFNPIPCYTTRDQAENNWGRSPLICAVSTNDGKGKSEESFDRIFYIEEDRSNGYCYPAIFEGKDYFLVAYYHSENTGICVKAAKIVKVYFSEIEELERTANAMQPS